MVQRKLAGTTVLNGGSLGKRAVSPVRFVFANPQFTRMADAMWHSFAH